MTTFTAHKQIHQELMKKRNELLREMKLPTDKSTPEKDLLDQATIFTHQLSEQCLKNKHWKSLRQIELALNRITRGRYGICEKCENPIPYSCLKIHPEAIYCITCQTEVERKISR